MGGAVDVSVDHNAAPPTARKGPRTPPAEDLWVLGHIERTVGTDIDRYDARRKMKAGQIQPDGRGRI